MASAVDLCNLALASLGDEATVSSISPPEGSAQAAHCATFYPMALNAALELHEWRFATRRTSLALLADAPVFGWSYAFARPNGCVKVQGVYASDSLDDADAIPYECESRDDGTDIILCNVDVAYIRYTSLVTDTTKFSALFQLSFVAMLSSFLAGPILKGDAGAAEAKRQLQIAMAYASQAKVSDANQSSRGSTYVPAGIAARY